ncbi:MAG: DUF5668 domain-containing protein [Ruminiclostridium sp.]|nr:DUF5668 domain-containing protein [Ruminiclostridium sp.]
MKKRNALGIVLVLAGIAWIIEMTGLVKINWGESFETLWPVILVAIGINLMVRQRKSIKTVVWLLTLAIFIGFGIYKGNESGNHIFENNNSILGTKIYNQQSNDLKPYENEVLLSKGTEKGKIILNLDAVNLNISDGNGELFVKADSNIQELKQRVSEGKQTIIEYSHERYDTANTVRNFNLQMNPGLQWEIEANIGAADGKLNFSKTAVGRIDLTIGAGDLDLIIGKQEINTSISLRAGAADLVLHIPEGTGLRVKGGKLLSDISYHNIAMEYKNGEYQSENYKDASQVIEVDILTAISAIKIIAE